MRKEKINGADVNCELIISRLPKLSRIKLRPKVQLHIVGAPTEVRPSKNRRMPLKTPRTRYSLVKGERIVRYVLNAWLRKFLFDRVLQFIPLAPGSFKYVSMWDGLTLNLLLPPLSSSQTTFF